MPGAVGATPSPPWRVVILGGLALNTNLLRDSLGADYELTAPDLLGPAPPVPLVVIAGSDSRGRLPTMPAGTVAVLAVAPTREAAVAALAAGADGSCSAAPIAEIAARLQALVRRLRPATGDDGTDLDQVAAWMRGDAARHSAAGAPPLDQNR